MRIKGKPGRPRITKSPLVGVSLTITQKALERADRIAGLASKETGREVGRSEIIRHLLDTALDEAERVRSELKRARRGK